MIDSAFAFSLYCLHAPLNTAACAPLWLCVSFVFFGGGATIFVLLVWGYLDWRRMRALDLKIARRAAEDAEPLI